MRIPGLVCAVLHSLSLSPRLLAEDDVRGSAQARGPDHGEATLTVAVVSPR